MQAKCGNCLLTHLYRNLVIASRAVRHRPLLMAGLYRACTISGTHGECVLPRSRCCHCHVQKTQESCDRADCSVAVFQVRPASVLTSTFSIPLLPAKARPPTSTVFPTAIRPMGRSRGPNIFHPMRTNLRTQGPVRRATLEKLGGIGMFLALVHVAT